MRRASDQSGAALVLVMWLVAAMGIVVGGALALARDEVALASARLSEAQAFAIGKGVARLAILDRARAQSGVGAGGEAEPATFSSVFRSEYQLDGFSVTATVYPASGFISLSETDAVVWQQLLTSMGLMDRLAAMTLAENIVGSEFEAIGPGRLGGGGDTNSFQFYSHAEQTKSALYVEQLLGIEGMQRAVYDRIRSSIAPSGVHSGVDSAASPPELAAAFADVDPGRGPAERVSASNQQNAGYYCVEIEVLASTSEGFVQRVWVESNGSENYSAVRIARLEKPIRKPAKQAG